MPLFTFSDTWPERPIEAYFTENSQIERRRFSFPMDSLIPIGRAIIWQGNLSERQSFSQLMDQSCGLYGNRPVLQQVPMRLNIWRLQRPLSYMAASCVWRTSTFNP